MRERHNHKQHRNKHTEQRRRYKCRYCPKAYLYKASLHKHQYEEHKARRLKGTLAATTTAKSSTTAENENFQCHFCGELFETRTMFSKHIYKHDEAKPYECDSCPKRFKMPHALQQHKRVYHAAAGTCDQCVAGNSDGNIKCECRKVGAAGGGHDDDVPTYKCEECNRTFVRNDHLTRHMTKVACVTCGETFTCKQANHLHVARQHPELVKVHKCMLCERSFVAATLLAKHVRTHTGEKPYQCHLCPQAFARRDTLMKHHRSHTGEKKYQCTLCDKRFAASYALVRHMKMHLGERYQCTMCEKSFSQKNDCRRHMKTHDISGVTGGNGPPKILVTAGGGNGAGIVGPEMFSGQKT